MVALTGSAVQVVVSAPFFKVSVIGKDRPYEVLRLYYPPMDHYNFARP